MAIRVGECPNCNHPSSKHRPLETGVEAHCDGDEAGPCLCPLDRGSVGVAIAVAAALVKFG